MQIRLNVSFDLLTRHHGVDQLVLQNSVVTVRVREPQGLDRGLRRLRVPTCKNHQTFAHAKLDDRGRPVTISCDCLPESAKIRTAVIQDLSYFSISEMVLTHGQFGTTVEKTRIVDGVGNQLESPATVIPGEKCPRAMAEITQAIFDGIAYFGPSTSERIIFRERVASGYDERGIQREVGADDGRYGIIRDGHRFQVVFDVHDIAGPGATPRPEYNAAWPW